MPSFMLFAARLRGRDPGLGRGAAGGVTASPVVLGPGVNQVAMVFRAAADAAELESRLQVKGTARLGDADAVRLARAGAIIYPAGGNAPRPARLARSVVLAVRPGAPYLLTAQADFAKLGQGSMLDLGLALERRSPDFGDKLVGVTVPMAPGTFENAAIEIPAGQTAGRLSLYVKPETPPGRYSVSVKGTAAIPFTKTPTDPNAKKNPVEVADPSPTIEITIVPRPAEIAPATAEPTGKPGQQITLGVKVNRQNGYVGPIELSLRLPPGLGASLPRRSLFPPMSARRMSRFNWPPISRSATKEVSPCAGRRRLVAILFPSTLGSCLRWYPDAVP